MIQDVMDIYSLSCIQSVSWPSYQWPITHINNIAIETDLTPTILFFFGKYHAI